jgi:osmotically inducible lipoprotein OsmB
MTRGHRWKGALAMTAYAAVLAGCGTTMEQRAATGAAAGLIVGGPVGAAVGAVVGAAVNEIEDGQGDADESIIK